VTDIQHEVIAYLLGYPSVFESEEGISSAVRQVNEQLKRAR
jgi:hypothetical protein